MLERLHISRYESSIDEWGYNIREGGATGPLHKKTREKLSLIHKGIKHTKETKQKISKTKRGSRYSVKHRGNAGKTKWKKYPGVTFNKRVNPEKKCWYARIVFNRWSQSLGTFYEPISGTIIYNFVWREIYDS